MARILFYSPFNQRSRDTESLMIAFHRQGHKVISLSQAEGKLIHEVLEQSGIETHSHVVSATGWRKHLDHLRYLVRFCRKHEIDVVYSHLESANFIAALAQVFVKAKVYVCRHHADQYKMLNLDKDISYRLTYRLAKNIIVPSESAKQHMIKEEKVNADKIRQINLAYDFSLYPPINENRIAEIRADINAACVLVTVGNFLPLKRPEISVQILKRLRSQGMNAKLVLLGKGELQKSLDSLTEQEGLKDFVFFPGYVDNVMEYIAASDFLIHPSVSEASCVSVKEAGLVKRPVLVCNGVGDFDEYIVQGQNGFLIDHNDFVNQAADIIKKFGNDATGRERIGENLRTSVVSLFGIDNVVKQYDALNKV